MPVSFKGALQGTVAPSGALPSALSHPLCVLVCQGGFAVNFRSLEGFATALSLPCLSALVCLGALHGTFAP
jgi:hypothetical protein